MGLEIRHNRATHTHENEQFRRIAISLMLLFVKKGWNGLLIGNPFSETFSRFRADALLLYDHGLLIIDLKDYKGNIKLPPYEDEFKSTKWYSESEVDKQRVEIKAGARFINPFRQLNAYREAMFEIIKSNLYLNANLEPKRTCAVNIFSGPITLQNQVPRSLPYYKLIQENELNAFLYDFSSVNSYSEESATALKSIFKAALWDENLDVSISNKPNEQRAIKIDKDVKTELTSFLKESASGIFVLESMHAHDRDDWMRFILSESVEFGVPQAETWAHSARISRKISRRTGIGTQSLYNTIYGGATAAFSEDNFEETEDSNTGNPEKLLEVVPLRSDVTIDEASVIVLHEAHLVSRSLYQSELLRFGTGRLLEDLIKFLTLDDTKRKLICIGDPYSLSYGKYEDSALHLDTLQTLYSGNIRHFRQPLILNDTGGTLGIRTDLAKNIENKIYNKLSFAWQQGNLELVDKSEAGSILKNWFKDPVINEPQNCALLYSNKNTRKTNLWIKKECLGNGTELAKDDILYINNNIHIPDPDGFGQPTSLSNGMYLLVKEKCETKEIPIEIKQSKTPVVLSFTKIKAICLSISGKPEAVVLILDNYFSSDNDLSKDEQIALRVFVNKKIEEQLKKHPFIDSHEYKQLIQDAKFLQFDSKEQKAVEKLIIIEKVSTTAAARALLSQYRNKHKKKLLAEISLSDPYVNAAFVTYGWALTVHKAVGSSFSQVLLNAYQGENRGITNSDYNRWLYSAITAASQIVYVSNPQEVNPMMDCTFEDLEGGGVPEEVTVRRTTLAFPNYNIVDKYQHIIGSTIKDHVAGAICELSLYIEGYGYQLKTVQTNNAYMTKAIYEIPNSDIKLVIILSNNAAGVVTAIRIENSAGIQEEPINKAIQQLFEQPELNDVSKDLIMPVDFRIEPYGKWTETLKENGFSLHYREAHNFQDVFEALKGKDKVKFRVYYNAKGFFTKITILHKSQPNLGQAINDWLFYTN